MEVRFHKHFTRRFKLLPDKVRHQFQLRLKTFLTEPHHPMLHNHSVDNAFPECRSINITGDYRAIFQTRGHIVIFLLIGTHSDLYS